MIQIPMEAWEKTFGMVARDRTFLIELYINHGDCWTFTIPLENDGEINHESHNFSRRVQRLIDAGVLRVVSNKLNHNMARQRIFEFVYPVGIFNC